jgi:hypothetical protein
VVECLPSKCEALSSIPCTTKKIKTIKKIPALSAGTPNMRAKNTRNKKLIELKEEKDKSTIRPGDFNHSFSTTDKTTRQKEIMGTEGLNHTIN